MVRGIGSAKALSWEQGSVFKEYQVMAQWLKENELRERAESSDRYITSEAIVRTLTSIECEIGSNFKALSRGVSILDLS